MRERDVAFILELVGDVPELRPLLNEHLADNYEEILPHVFLADVLRYALAHPREAAVATTLERLEEAFRLGDEERKELISTGFLENLPVASEDHTGLRARLGPMLCAEAGRVT